MKKTSRLSDLFSAIGAKYLQRIDADPNVSHQHEVGGLSSLRAIWGASNLEKKIETTYIYVGDSELPLRQCGFITWYNARRHEPHRGPEWRVYYEDNEVTRLMKPGDFLVIAQKKDGKAFFIVAPRDSDGEFSLMKLFSIKEIKKYGVTLVDTKCYKFEFDQVDRQILDYLEIEYEYYDDNILEIVIDRFKGSLPSSKELSAFAREHSKVTVHDGNPDFVLITWYTHEELIFRTYERYLFEERIKRGFTEIDDFIDFSLSILNRRKSRAGKALENHVEYIFKELRILYDRAAITENRSRPDFLFPSQRAYHNLNFSDGNLAMLGVKTTCKDRWRQVLAEANRIKRKHLLTLQPNISANQIREMKSNDLQLVVIESLLSNYPESERQWIWTFSNFCNWIVEMQKIR